MSAKAQGPQQLLDLREYEFDWVQIWAVGLTPHPQATHAPHAESNFLSVYLYNPWSNGTRVFATATTGTATYRQLAKLAPTNESLAERLEIYQHRVVEEFFDVEQDPDCTVNLIASEKHQQLIQQQRDRLMAWMQETGDPMIVIYRDRENAAAREAFVQKQEAESAARSPKRGQNKEKNPPAAVKKIKLFTVVLPKTVVPGSVAKMVITRKLPAAMGEQKIHITLIEGKENKRVDRQVHRIKGKGQLTVEFKVPATVSDGLVRFAAFVSEDFQSNVQHYKTTPIKAK